MDAVEKCHSQHLGCCNCYRLWETQPHITVNLLSVGGDGLLTEVWRRIDGTTPKAQLLLGEGAVVDAETSSITRLSEGPHPPPVMKKLQPLGVDPGCKGQFYLIRMIAIPGCGLQQRPTGHWAHVAVTALHLVAWAAPGAIMAVTCVC